MIRDHSVVGRVSFDKVPTGVKDEKEMMGVSGVEESTGAKVQREE